MSIKEKASHALGAGESELTTELEARFDAACLEFPKEFAAAECGLKQRLAKEQVVFDDGPLPISMKPHFLPNAVHRDWVALGEKFFVILEKLAQRFVEDDELFALLRLPPGSKELVRIDPGYRRIAVISRPDMVWHQKVLRLIEVNCDSPAMMTFSDSLQNALLDTWPLAKLSEAHSIHRNDRTAVLLDGILECYREWGGKKIGPTIAVVDWAGGKTRFELVSTARRFEALGCPAFVCTPQDLDYRGGILSAKGHRIDIVQRRVLFPEFLARPDELASLVSAYRDGKVCMVNPLSSYVVGNKSLLVLLQLPELQAQLTAKEQETVQAILPKALFLDADHREQIEGAKDRWVLKGSFSHGGKDVVIGSSATVSEWSDALRRSEHSRWIAQEKQNIPTYRLPVSDGHRLAMESFFINWNPWFFAGRFAGGTSRTSKAPIVSLTARGALLPTMAVE